VTDTARPSSKETRLVADCLAGDGAAWKALLAEFGSLVWAVARRAGLSDADAADVFQNTWTVALEELPRLRDPSRFAGWIARITRHQAMRVRRGYGIARRAHERVAREDVDVNLPEAELQEMETRHRVKAALEHVGERCAELLGLLYYEQPTPAYAVIADRLGMRIGSIGPTRARCLESLRKQLGESDV